MAAVSGVGAFAGTVASERQRGVISSFSVEARPSEPIGCGDSLPGRGPGGESRCGHRDAVSCLTLNVKRYTMTS